MGELEKKLKEAKEKLKKYTIVSIVELVIILVGAALLIYGLINKKGGQLPDRLFAVGLGIVIAVVVINTTMMLVHRHEIDEYYYLKREIRHANKK